MKSTLILSLATFALASAVQLPHNNVAIADTLMNRAIDPATMDPTQFSILSVLKTAMPTTPNMPMPSRGFEPVWYKELPEDVKALLPKFYPVVEVAGLGGGNGDVGVASEVSTTVGEGGKSEETGVVSLVSNLLSSPTFASTSNTSPSSFSSTGGIATTTSTSPFPPSSPSLSSFLSSSSSTSTTAASPSPLTSATPSTPFNAGSKASVNTGLLAAVAWVSLAAGFCVFA